MEVKVVFFDVLSPYMNDKLPKYEEVLLPITDTLTLQELFDTVKHGTADISNYYLLSKSYYYNQGRLPYIIDGRCKIVWEPTYDSIKVVDFIRTHNIDDNTIHADTGIPQVGGKGTKDLILLWNEYYPIIDQISSLFGFGAGVIGIGLFVKSLFVKGKKPSPPHGVFDLILSKDKWNYHDLSDCLEFEQEDVKKLLQAFGYKWDHSKKIYILHGDINEIRDKLSSVKMGVG